jgi:hypothetical protein
MLKMQTPLPQIYYIIFTAITAGGVLLQALVLLGMFIAIRKSAQKMQVVSDELKGQLVPTISAARRLIEDVSPKLKIATADLVEITGTLRRETTHVSAAVDDVVNKTSAQAARVDEMLGAVLTTVEHASTVVQQAAAAPLRQITGIMAGLRAGFDVLRSREKESEKVDIPETEIPQEVIP